MTKSSCILLAIVDIYIIAVKAKPARVGLWFYQLVGCLDNWLTYKLHSMMMRVDKSRNETAVVDEVMM